MLTSTYDSAQGVDQLFQMFYSERGLRELGIVESKDDSESKKAIKKEIVS